MAAVIATEVVMNMLSIFNTTKQYGPGLGRAQVSKRAIRTQ